MTNIQRGDLIRFVLGVVATGGIVVGAGLCPGLLQAIRPFVKKRYGIASLRQTIHRLDKKGWILGVQNEQGLKIILSKKGRQELQQYELGSKQLVHPKTWDKKWRLLLFDIPESKKQLRDTVRNFLRQLGFQRLQDSAWLYPYECREVINLLRVKYNVRFDALYLIVEGFAGDRWLRKQFGLPFAKITP